MAGAVAAMGMLGLGASLLTWALWSGIESALAASMHVLALGWLGGLGLAMLYKIIPFLTWLECFAPLMGRITTPRVQDLVNENRAAPWFVLYFAAELASAAALLLKVEHVFQLTTMLQLLGAVGLVVQYVRARRLADLPTDWQNHPRPRLILPATRKRSVV